MATKADLIFDKPIMNAAGALGFAPDPRAPITWSELGSFVTNPISLRPRGVTRLPTAETYAGGCLVHTGLPNPGFSAVQARFAHRWAEAPLPIIVHLIGDRPEEARQMVRRLEGMDNVLGIELSFAPLLADDLIVLGLEMCRGELPLIASLPLEQMLRLGPRAMQAGASAVSMATPRGAVPRDDGQVSGRLYGPSVFPAAFEVLRASVRLGLPCIAAGGLYSSESIGAMLGAGALAVQVDTAFWLPRTDFHSLVD